MTVGEHSGGEGRGAEPVVALRDVRLAYRTPEGGTLAVLDVAAWDVAAHEQVGLAGGSGTGKTTLLHVLGGIRRPDAGSVRVAGRDLAQLSEARRDAFRAEHVGYVFQTFHLLDGFTALENVLLGMSFGPGPDRGLARELLERLGLGARLSHRPAQLSIGQRQRVAVARALANRPRLVLADEPTGNLDPERAQEALSLLSEACCERGAALVCVSHDPRVLERLDRVVALADVNRARPDGGGAP